MPPRATAARTAPARSKRWAGWADRDSGTCRTAIQTVSTASGRLTRKIHATRRHRSGCHRGTGRPRPRCRRGPTTRRWQAPGPPSRTAPWIIARLPGREQAPADALEQPRHDERLRGRRETARSEAAANQMVPTTKNRRRPVAVAERPAEQDQRGERERYPCPIHWSSASEASRSSPIVRRATLTTVPCSGSARSRGWPPRRPATPWAIPSVRGSSRIHDVQVPIPRVVRPRSVEQRPATMSTGWAPSIRRSTSPRSTSRSATSRPPTSASGTCSTTWPASSSRWTATSWS